MTPECLRIWHCRYFYYGCRIIELSRYLNVIFRQSTHQRYMIGWLIFFPIIRNTTRCISFKTETFTLNCMMRSYWPCILWSLQAKKQSLNDKPAISIPFIHYSDVIMSAMASQIFGVPIVCSTVCSGRTGRKHQSSASLVFVRGIHRWPVDSPHTGPVTGIMFPLDDVIMFSVCNASLIKHTVQSRHNRISAIGTP